MTTSFARRTFLFPLLIALFGALFFVDGVFAQTASEPIDILKEVHPECLIEIPDIYPDNIYDKAVENNFSIFIQAVDAAGAQSLLQSENGWTVLAPTNAAFQALPAGTLEELLADQVKMRQVILFHLLQDRYEANEIPTGSVRTALGKNHTIAAGPVIGDGAQLTTRNIEATNGIMHGINKVLLPPFGDFTTRSRPPAPPRELLTEPCQCQFDLIAAGINRFEEAVMMAPATPVDSVGNASYTIQVGDSLSIIALQFYGNGDLWTQIAEDNADLFANPDLITPGVEIVIR